MAKWTVFKVVSLHNGGPGQSLQKLGTVEADSFNRAIAAAFETFRSHANPGAPGGGLTVIEASPLNNDN